MHTGVKNSSKAHKSPLSAIFRKSVLTGNSLYRDRENVQLPYFMLFFCIFRHQLRFLNFPKSCFSIPSFVKIHKSSEKCVCTTLNCSFPSRMWWKRIVLYLWKSVITVWLIARSGQRSDTESNMAMSCHDKKIENSWLSLSIYTFSSLIFHKPLTYDRNHIISDRLLLLKSCCIRCSTRTPVG